MTPFPGAAQAVAAMGEDLDGVHSLGFGLAQTLAVTGTVGRGEGEKQWMENLFWPSI